MVEMGGCVGLPTKGRLKAGGDVPNHPGLSDQNVARACMSAKLLNPNTSPADCKHLGSHVADS